jgi:soluble lytic murein transglycosylase-like protein
VTQFRITDCVVGGAVGLLLSSAASADVLEVAPGSSAWVAGGPAAIEGGTATRASSPDPVTLVNDGAGPAAWRDNLARLAKKYDLSAQLLEAVVWQESRWREQAVSSAGARGLAQLMPGTARELGVNAADPAANLEGAARYLRMQLDAFGGDLEKALAAYNAGPARVRRAGGIPPIRETQNYVAAIIGRLSSRTGDK